MLDLEMVKLLSKDYQSLNKNQGMMMKQQQNIILQMDQT